MLSSVPLSFVKNTRKKVERHRSCFVRMNPDQVLNADLELLSALDKSNYLPFLFTREYRCY